MCFCAYSAYVFKFAYYNVPLRYLAPLSPWRGAGGEAFYIKPEGCDGIADVRIRGIALDNGLTCGKVYRDRTYSGDIAQGFLH